MTLPGTLVLIDTSAASRAAHQPQIQTMIEKLADDGAAATCVTVDLEAGFSAQSAKAVPAMLRTRAVLMTVLPITEEIAQRAREVQALLAGRGMHRAVGVIDLLTAATAELHGASVLHYDADFEHIASVTGQRHMWVVPRGSIS